MLFRDMSFLGTFVGCLCIFYVCVHMSVYMRRRERTKRMDSVNVFSVLPII